MAVLTENPADTDPFRIMPLAHNWSSPYRYSVEFKTDIITSVNGREQRRAVRHKPRHFAEMSANMNGRSRVNMDLLMTGWHTKPVLVGLEQFAVRTAGPMAPEQDNIVFLAPPGGQFWFQPGQTVVIVHADDPAIRESRVVASANPTSLGFVDSTESEFPMRSRIMPAYLAYLEPEQAISRLTNRVATAGQRIVFMPESTPPLFPADPVYEGPYEIFQWKPNWGGAQDMTYSWPRSMIDYGYGRVKSESPIAFPTRIYKHDYVGRSHAETYAIMAFFQRHFGMQREFFMPTWEDDIPFTSLAGGGQSILVDGPAFGTIYEDSSVFRRIMLRYPDGSVSYHQVEYIQPLPDTNSSVVRVTEPLPVTELTPQTVLGISWLLVARFAIDRMDVDFLTNSVSQFSLTMQTLENFEL